MNPTKEMQLEERRRQQKRDVKAALPAPCRNEDVAKLKIMLAEFAELIGIP